jgi:hypothetical protein
MCFLPDGVLRSHRGLEIAFHLGHQRRRDSFARRETRLDSKLTRASPAQWDTAGLDQERHVPLINPGLDVQDESREDDGHHNSDPTGQEDMHNSLGHWLGMNFNLKSRPM